MEGEPEPGGAQQQVLRLFRAAAELVPAFKSFLEEAGVEPASIKTIEVRRPALQAGGGTLLRAYTCMHTHNTCIRTYMHVCMCLGVV